MARVLLLGDEPDGDALLRAEGVEHARRRLLVVGERAGAEVDHGQLVLELRAPFLRRALEHLKVE